MGITWGARFLASYSTCHYTINSTSVPNGYKKSQPLCTVPMVLALAFLGTTRTMIELGELASLTREAVENSNRALLVALGGLLALVKLFLSESQATLTGYYGCGNTSSDSKKSTTKRLSLDGLCFEVLLSVHYGILNPPRQAAQSALQRQTDACALVQELPNPSPAASSSPRDVAGRSAEPCDSALRVTLSYQSARQLKTLTKVFHDLEQACRPPQPALHWPRPSPFQR